MANTSCDIKKTRMIKNPNGTKSTFRLVNGGEGLSKTDAAKKKAAIEKRGNRVRVVESKCGLNVFVGPKKKTGNTKKKKSTRRKKK